MAFLLVLGLGSALLLVEAGLLWWSARQLWQRHWVRGGLGVAVWVLVVYYCWEAMLLVLVLLPRVLSELLTR